LWPWAQNMLIRMQKSLPQAYVPGLYEVKYSATARLRVWKRNRRITKENKDSSGKRYNVFCTEEVISSPRTEMAEMYLTEVNRGCFRSCRFCAASFIYRPARFRSFEQIVASIDRGLEKRRKSVW